MKDGQNNEINQTYQSNLTLPHKSEKLKSFIPFDAKPENINDLLLTDMLTKEIQDQKEKKEYLKLEQMKWTTKSEIVELKTELNRQRIFTENESLKLQKEEMKLAYLQFLRANTEKFLQQINIGNVGKKQISDILKENLSPRNPLISEELTEDKFDRNRKKFEIPLNTDTMNNVKDEMNQDGMNTLKALDLDILSSLKNYNRATHKKEKPKSEQNVTDFEEPTIMIRDFFKKQVIQQSPLSHLLQSLDLSVSIARQDALRELQILSDTENKIIVVHDELTLPSDWKFKKHKSFKNTVDKDPILNQNSLKESDKIITPQINKSSQQCLLERQSSIKYPETERQNLLNQNNNPPTNLSLINHNDIENEKMDPEMIKEIQNVKIKLGIKSQEDYFDWSKKIRNDEFYKKLERKLILERNSYSRNPDADLTFGEKDTQNVIYHEFTPKIPKNAHQRKKAHLIQPIVQTLTSKTTQDQSQIESNESKNYEQYLRIIKQKIKHFKPIPPQLPSQKLNESSNSKNEKQITFRPDLAKRKTEIVNNNNSSQMENDPSFQKISLIKQLQNKEYAFYPNNFQLNENGIKNTLQNSPTSYKMIRDNRKTEKTKSNCNSPMKVSPRELSEEEIKLQESIQRLDILLSNHQKKQKNRKAVGQSPINERKGLHRKQMFDKLRSPTPHQPEIPSNISDNSFSTAGQFQNFPGIPIINNNSSYFQPFVNLRSVIPYNIPGFSSHYYTVPDRYYNQAVLPLTLIQPLVQQPPGHNVVNYANYNPSGAPLLGQKNFDNPNFKILTAPDYYQSNNMMYQTPHNNRPQAHLETNDSRVQKTEKKLEYSTKRHSTLPDINDSKLNNTIENQNSDHSLRIFRRKYSDGYHEKLKKKQFNRILSQTPSRIFVDMAHGDNQRISPEKYPTMQARTLKKQNSVAANKNQSSSSEKYYHNFTYC